MKEGQCLWEILVPTVRNDGRPFSLKYHRVWDAKVRAITGGLTICPPTIGQWLAPCGQLFKERMIPVRIACTEEQIEKISDLTAMYYQQHAIFFYLVSSKVYIRSYAEPKFVKARTNDMSQRKM